jgi:hypothetical protein
MDDRRVSVLLPIHLPASLCSAPVTALPSSYGGSVTRLPFTCAAAGIPDSQHLNCLSFCLQPPHVLPCTLPPRSFVFAFWTFPRRTVSRPRPPGFRASSLASRLARIMRPNRVSLVRTDRLTFRCSPPRLTTTQLRAVFNQSSVWLRGFISSFSDVLSSALAPAFRRGKQGRLPNW